MPASKTASSLRGLAPDHHSPYLAEDAAIYVHWPFCLKKCPYCDFNSHVREQVTHKDWRTALVREIDTFAANFPNLNTKSVFFGGGTPSLMEPETVATVIEAIQKHWGNSSGIEITLEANPSSVEAGRFRAYREAGINRLSVGIQSLKDDVLKFLGRLHSAEEALKALKVAQDNFDRVSFDLIYARPEQSLADWEVELKEALSFGTDHLSLYQLTIEEGTAFYHQFHRGKFSLPDEDDAAALFELTQELTEDAGLPAYEVSNHAKAGQESQHNLCYWRGDHYVGIGPGAHGRLPHSRGRAWAHSQIKRPEDWLKSVVSRGTGLEIAEEVSAEERAVEKLMMGLRLTEGLDTAEISEVIDHQELDALVASGHVSKAGSRIKLTKKGQPLLNFILGKLVA
jgi:putative oxygen-independent coproporphyrinogen III oxidase